MAIPVSYQIRQSSRFVCEAVSRLAIGAGYETRRETAGVVRRMTSSTASAPVRLDVDLVRRMLAINGVTFARPS